MHFPFKTEVPDDVMDIFNNQLIVDMGRPYINGQPVDERTWTTIKRIITNRCMSCFPIHYPSLYIKLHNHKLTQRAIFVFKDAMYKIKDKGCPCSCHDS